MESLPWSWYTLSKSAVLKVLAITLLFVTVLQICSLLQYHYTFSTLTALTG